jgi:hypothetical protein
MRAEEWEMGTPYASGQIPMVGDRVQHMNGQIGKITHVQLDQGNTPGEIQVSVAWEEGGGIGVSLAREYKLISRKE